MQPYFRFVRWTGLYLVLAVWGIGCSGLFADLEELAEEGDIGVGDIEEGDVGCLPGEDVCQEGGFDLQSSLEHCGDCGDPCVAPEGGAPICFEGECLFTCPGERTACGEACVNTDSSHAHCGQCNNDCGDAEVCHEGSCLGVCPGGLSVCSGGCADTQSDIDHCGACENSCDAPLNAVAVCDDGECGVQCDPGLTLCDGTCVDGDSSAGHCGECNASCSTQELSYCLGGQCVGCLEDSDCGETLIWSCEENACRCEDTRPEVEIYESEEASCFVEDLCGEEIDCSQFCDGLCDGDEVCVGCVVDADCEGGLCDGSNTCVSCTDEE